MMQQRKPLMIYDLEAMFDAAEYIITSAQYNFIDYDDDGNYIACGMPQNVRCAKREEWIAGMKTHYLCFRENEELHSIGFQDALCLSLSEIKEKYLKEHMVKLRNVLRKDSVDLNMAPVSDEVPDSYLEDLLAMAWKETLKLWAMQWGKDWNKAKDFEEYDPRKTYYEENDLTEELKCKIGMISLNVPNQYILLPVEFLAYTIDGNIYEITPVYQYWKELLKSEYVGGGYMGRVFELEHEGWKKYFSKSLLTYYLIAPDFVDEAERIIGEEDVYHALKELNALFIKRDGTRYYARKRV